MDAFGVSGKSGTDHGRRRSKSKSDSHFNDIKGLGSTDISEREIQKLFDYLDANGNGTIEARELRRFYKKRKGLGDSNAKVRRSLSKMVCYRNY